MDISPLRAARDQWAPRWDALFGSANPSAHRVRQLYFQEARNRCPPGSWVVCVGCGAGEDVVELAKAGVKVWGLDWSPALIAQARARASQAGVVDRVSLEVLAPGELGALVGTAFPEERLDGVIAPWGALNQEEDLPKFFDAAYRALRPSGRIFATLLNPRSLSDLAGAVRGGRVTEALSRARGGAADGQWVLDPQLPALPVHFPTLAELGAIYGTRFEVEKRLAAPSVTLEEQGGLVGRLRKLEGALSRLPLQTVSGQTVMVLRRAIEGMWGPAGPHLLANE